MRHTLAIVLALSLASLSAHAGNTIPTLLKDTTVHFDKDSQIVIRGDKSLSNVSPSMCVLKKGILLGEATTPKGRRVQYKKKDATNKEECASGVYLIEKK